MNKYLIVFLISMVPLIELRGAIPYAVGYDLPIAPSIAVALLGNMLPVPFIFLFARKILSWGKDKQIIGGFCRWCLEKGEKGVVQFAVVIVFAYFEVFSLFRRGDYAVKKLSFPGFEL